MADGNGGPAPNVVADPPAGEGVELKGLSFVIHIPDLKNGDISTIQQAAPKASVSSDYKWVNLLGLDAAKASDAVEWIIRGTYAQLVNAAGANPGPEALIALRKKAIVIGGVRAGATAAYRLSPQDMNVTECVAGPYRVENGRVMGTNGNETAGRKYALAQGMPPLEPVEVAAVGMLVYLGIAVPVLQGASLVNSGHHYLPTTKNIFAGQKKQALGLVKEDVAAWVESMGEAFDDMAFHKACHPISPPSKRRWAKTSDIAQKLQMSGHGAAAIRLPALPSDAAIGKTSIALANAARSTIASMGHSMSVSQGPALILALERADEGIEERKAVTDIISWAAAHVASIAFCAGIVQHVTEMAGVGRSTLLTAYSVKKLMKENAQSVQLGLLYARAAAAKARTEMDEGRFSDPNISM